MKSLFAKKSVADFETDVALRDGLKRTLGKWHLTALGVGATLGEGEGLGLSDGETDADALGDADGADAGTGVASSAPNAPATPTRISNARMSVPARARGIAGRRAANTITVMLSSPPRARASFTSASAARSGRSAAALAISGSVT